MEIAALDSRVGFTILFALVALERLLELALSERNRRWAAARGAVAPESRSFYALMVVTHTLFLVAAPAEVWLLDRRFLPELAAPMLGLAIAAMALRYWAIATLGVRWSTRVVVVPGLAPITGGPYRYVRHPNYVAVVIEMFALPLVHTAWLTALVWSAANALLLSARVRHEEAALARHADYGAAFGERPRFLPGGSR